MTTFDAIIFDFDGVLLESEFEGNVQLADLLTELGHRHSVAETIRHYTGLSGDDFIAAVEKRIGERLPRQFHDRMKEKSAHALKEGIEAVAGAVEFVRSLPPGFPKAVASSLSRERLSRLASAIHEVLESRNRPPGRYTDTEGRDRFAVYDREGLACSRCRTLIKRIPQAGRSTYFCPTCQKR